MCLGLADARRTLPIVTNIVLTIKFGGGRNNEMGLLFKD